MTYTPEHDELLCRVLGICSTDDFPPVLSNPTWTTHGLVVEALRRTGYSIRIEHEVLEGEANVSYCWISKLQTANEHILSGIDSEDAVAVTALAAWQLPEVKAHPDYPIESEANDDLK